MKLCDEFLRLCKELAQKENALHTEMSVDKQMTCFSLYYRVSRVELVYSRKWETLAPPSVLYARIYLNKNKPIYLHLPELIAYLNAEDYRACYFPYIESKQRLTDCFAALMELLHDYIPKAEHLGSTGEDRAIMDRWATEGFFDDGKEDQETPSQEKIDWDTMVVVRRLQEGIMVSRHTNLDAYQAFLNGDKEKAIQKYDKLTKSGLSLYEKGLVEFMKSDASRSFVPMPPRCCSAAEYKMGENGDITDLKGIALLYGVFSCFFCGLLAVINAVLSHGTVYFYGAQWWFGFVLAVIPALFCYFAFQRSLRRKLGGEVAFYDIQKSAEFARYFAGVAFAAAMIGCLWFCIAVPPMSSRYYDSYAVYYTENEATERFEYTQVIEVCHISARYNVYGDRVERDSYVLILDDGRYIDLDSDGSTEQQLEMLRRLFPEIAVRELDSDRDLPGTN